MGLVRISRRHVAGINRHKAVGEQHRKGRLRPLQVKSNLPIAIGGYLSEVVKSRFKQISPQFLRSLVHSQVPGAFDILGAERLAVMPFDAAAQLKGQLGPVLVPYPAGRQIGHDRLQTVLRRMLVEHDQVVEHTHHWSLGENRHFLHD
jgi:hypothetical protein